tara:strand:- start:563 stop:682 length:120 start_codon:yes stop_codon:yes gene_type:complete
MAILPYLPLYSSKPPKKTGQKTRIIAYLSALYATLHKET